MEKWTHITMTKQQVYKHLLQNVCSLVNRIEEFGNLFQEEPRLCLFLIVKEIADPVVLNTVNWVSEASPTLGSIKISYVYMSVCLSCHKMRRRNYIRACSKSVLGGKN